MKIVDYESYAIELLDLTEQKMPSDEQIQDFAECSDEPVDQSAIKTAIIDRLDALDNDLEYYHALARTFNTLRNTDFSKYNYDLE